MADPVYATIDDLRTYMGVSEGELPDDEATSLLLKSEADIDRLAGRSWPVDVTTGRRFAAPLGTNVLGLGAYQIERLTEAVCAQAEYRYTVGETFFIEDQPKSVQGPDFTEEGQRSMYGPKARAALGDSGLLRLTGRAVR
jgi:hypothetical protein